MRSPLTPATALAMIATLALLSSLYCASSTPNPELNTRENFDPTGVPSLSSPVTDIYGAVGHDVEAELNSALRKLQRETGFRVAVLVVPDTGKESAGQYAARIYNAHDLGGDGPNDGLLLLVAIDTKDIWTEMGVHLLPILSREEALAISTQIMIPYFKKKQYHQGIYAGTGAIIKALRRPPGAERPTP